MIDREAVMREVGLACLSGMLGAIPRTEQEATIGEAIIREFSSTALQHLVGALANTVFIGGINTLFRDESTYDTLAKASPPLSALNERDERTLAAFCRYCAILRWTPRPKRKELPGADNA